MKYIVTWCIISYILTSPSITKDEFNRINTNITAVCHYTISYDCNNKKEFINSRKDAFEFYKRAKEQLDDELFESSLDSIKIDSIKLK